MRGHGVPVREIAGFLAISVREVYRLLQDVAASAVRLVRSSASPAVQRSPALSDFRGAGGAVLAASGGAESDGNDSVIDDVFASEPSTAHGGAIAAAIVSEYAVPARSAEPESDTTSDGRGVRGETDAGESPIAYIKRRIRVAKLQEREPPPQDGAT